MEALGTDCVETVKKSRPGHWSRTSMPGTLRRSEFTEISSGGHPFVAGSTQLRKDERTRTDSQFVGYCE